MITVPKSRIQNQFTPDHRMPTGFVAVFYDYPAVGLLFCGRFVSRIGLHCYIALHNAFCFIFLSLHVLDTVWNNWWPYQLTELLTDIIMFRAIAFVRIISLPVICELLTVYYAVTAAVIKLMIYSQFTLTCDEDNDDIEHYARYSDVNDVYCGSDALSLNV